jgi:hypothetical protein
VTPIGVWRRRRTGTRSAWPPAVGRRGPMVKLLQAGVDSQSRPILEMIRHGRVMMFGVSVGVGG